EPRRNGGAVRVRGGRRAAHDLVGRRRAAAHRRKGSRQPHAVRGTIFAGRPLRGAVRRRAQQLRARDFRRSQHARRRGPRRSVGADQRRTDDRSRADLGDGRTAALLHLGARRLPLRVGPPHGSRDGPADGAGVSGLALPSRARAAAIARVVVERDRAHRVSGFPGLHDRGIDRQSLVASRGGRTMTLDTLSIVVISRNEGAQLRATMDDLLRTLPKRCRDVIVVDDGSTDGSTACVERCPGVRVFRTDTVGVANARNFGASRAEGDVILFCDAHMRLPARWRRALLEPLESPRVGAVGPGVYSLTEPQRRGFGLYLSGPDLHARWKQKPGRRPSPVPVLPGCFLAMRRDVFAATGGFDCGMRQLGGNDNELSLRLWLLGYELLIVPAVEVGHLF